MAVCIVTQRMQDVGCLDAGSGCKQLLVAYENVSFEFQCTESEPRSGLSIFSIAHGHRSIIIYTRTGSRTPQQKDPTCRPMNTAVLCLQSHLSTWTERHSIRPIAESLDQKQMLRC